MSDGGEHFFSYHSGGQTTQQQNLSALKLRVSSQRPIFSPVHYGEICLYFSHMETFPQTSPPVVFCLALLNSLITSLVYSKWWFHLREKKKRNRYLYLAGVMALFVLNNQQIESEILKFVLISTMTAMIIYCNIFISTIKSGNAGPKRSKNKEHKANWRKSATTS